MDVAPATTHRRPATRQRMPQPAGGASRARGASRSTAPRLFHAPRSSGDVRSFHQSYTESFHQSYKEKTSSNASLSFTMHRYLLHVCLVNVVLLCSVKRSKAEMAAASGRRVSTIDRSAPLSRSSIVWRSWARSLWVRMSVSGAAMRDERVGCSSDLEAHFKGTPTVGGELRPEEENLDSGRGNLTREGKLGL